MPLFFYCFVEEVIVDISALVNLELMHPFARDSITTVSRLRADDEYEANNKSYSIRVSN